MLRKMSGPKIDEVAEEWRRLHKQERHDLYPSSNTIRMIKSRRMRWAEHVASTGERKGAYRGYVGKPEGKRPLVRPRRRWENGSSSSRLGRGGVNWIVLAQDRYRWRTVVNAIINFRVT
jgi:hypothetical protein